MRTRLWLAAIAIGQASLAAAADLELTHSSAGGSASAAATEAPVPPRTAAEVRRQVRGAMRQVALTAGAEENAALRQLVAAYELLQSDRLLGDTERGEFRRSVRARLSRALEGLERRLAQAKRPRSVHAGQAGEVLAQQLPPPGNPAQPGAGRPRGAPPNPAVDDYGPELVDLIRSTIAPDTWDVNGGNGTIVYYRPLRVLVVRQTGDVHEAISNVLGGLRQ